MTHHHNLLCPSVQFSHWVVSDSLRPHELQYARPPCPSPTPGVHPNPCPLYQWCHPTISSSVIPSIHLPKANFPTSQTLHERWESDSNILYSWPHFKFQNLNPYLKITFYSQVFRYFLSPLSALCHYWVEYLPILLPLLDGIPSVLIRSVMSDSSQSHGLQSARLLCPQGFSRQEYWRRLPCPPPGDLPNPGTEPRSPALWADSISYHSSCHLATRTHLYKSLHRVLSSTFHLL